MSFLRGKKEACIHILPVVLSVIGWAMMAFHGRYESVRTLALWLPIFVFVTAGGILFHIRIDVADQVLRHFFPNIDDAVSFRPGLILVWFLTAMGYAVSVLFLRETFINPAYILK